jgi:hypothetical protein
MRRPDLALLLIAPALLVSGCGRGEKVDTATYTCAEFNKSLRTKDDNTSGQFINRLRDKAKLGQETKLERREITFGIILACRGKPGSTRPGDKAIVTAKQLRDGKFKPPAAPKAKKKKSG